MKTTSWRTTVGGAMIALGTALKYALKPEYAIIGDSLIGLGGLIVGASALDHAATK